MYKKTLLGSSKIPVECNSFEAHHAEHENTIHPIDYYLVENYDYFVKDSNGLHKYGLSVSKRNNCNETEEEIIVSISDSRETVENIISSLCKNAVTPISLPDVISDVRNTI